MSEIGDRIRNLREARGISQRDMDGEFVSYSYLSRIEAGDRQPSEKALRYIASKLGVTPHYLETGSDSGVCAHCLQPLK